MFLNSWVFSVCLWIFYLLISLLSQSISHCESSKPSKLKHCKRQIWIMWHWSTGCREQCHTQLHRCALSLLCYSEKGPIRGSARVGSLWRSLWRFVTESTSMAWFLLSSASETFFSIFTIMLLDHGCVYRVFIQISLYFAGLWQFQLHMWLFFSGRPTSSPQCRITTTSLQGQMNVKCISPTSRAGTAATIVSLLRNVSLPTGHVCSTYTSINQTGDRHRLQKTAQTPEVQTLGCFSDSEPLCPFEDKTWTFELEPIKNKTVW